jgi:hypothetical protein
MDDSFRAEGFLHIFIAETAAFVNRAGEMGGGLYTIKVGGSHSRQLKRFLTTKWAKMYNVVENFP